MPTGKTIIVANRIPLTMKKVAESNTWTYTKSSGGLVAALTGLKKEMEFLWVGWPGMWIEEEDRSIVEEDLQTKHACIPVYLTPGIVDGFYNGFSNKIMWPLCHYLNTDIDFDEDSWVSYKKANVEFAQKIIEVAEEGDSIWIHDYHLTLLPKLLRDFLKKKVTIGFFYHIPFPSSEIYRTLPVRRDTLEGILASDLIGFHTYEYAKHFLDSCTKILGLETTINTVTFDGRIIEVKPFPIGIDPSSFKSRLKTDKVNNRIKELESHFLGKKIFIGVDRLDYIKGLPNKLYAFDYFLKEHPEYKNNSILIQIAVPSRTDVDEYKKLNIQCNELTGEINGRYGIVEFSPVHFLNQSIDLDELTALYAIADVCVVTSLRDGMNLVSYEFIASQEAKKGVLILSEFTGAAQALDGTILINPWNTKEVSDAYYESITISNDARIHNYEKMSKYVEKFTASYWGTHFIENLHLIGKDLFLRNDPKEIKINEILEMAKDHIGDCYIFFSCDNSILPRRRIESKASIYVCSGNSKRSIQTTSDYGIIAEYGGFFKMARKRDNTQLPSSGIINASPDIVNASDSPQPSDTIPPSPKTNIPQSNPVDPSADIISSASSVNSLPAVLPSTKSTLVDSPIKSTGSINSISDNLPSEISNTPGTLNNGLNKRNTNDKNQNGVDNGFSQLTIEDDWRKIDDASGSDWKGIVRKVFEHHTKRVPDSYINEGECFITWEFEGCNQEFAQMKAIEMKSVLEGLLVGKEIKIIRKKTNLIVKPKLVDMAKTIEFILDESIDKTENEVLVLIIGDTKLSENYIQLIKELKNNIKIVWIERNCKNPSAEYYTEDALGDEFLLNL
eukprot:GHVP01031564.1.p1 GENE.GHVP01031564.1~~GHVP01031564.1.p1  ORF type:complete len:844 (-),score=153.51 GHVP01031564.1:52-2583(-)